MRLGEGGGRGGGLLGRGGVFGGVAGEGKGGRGNQGKCFCVKPPSLVCSEY